MRVNELFEVSANPDYLRAAERSLSQAIATQRTFGKSPEEKAAARRTELKREKGMQGYGRRHRAANPEMYPEIKPRPAAKLRDPSTEYSDDYSTWAAGRRDTMEQGVAEGLNENLQADDGEYYSNSDDFFSQFESDWFDKEETSPDGMEIRGYIDGVNVMAWRFKSAKKIGGWGIYDDSALKQGVAEGRTK
jgi:hypothetical protein